MDSVQNTISFVQNIVDIPYEITRVFQYIGFSPY